MASVSGRALQGGNCTGCRLRGGAWLQAPSWAGGAVREGLGRIGRAGGDKKSLWGRFAFRLVGQYLQTPHPAGWVGPKDAPGRASVTARGDRKSVDLARGREHVPSGLRRQNVALRAQCPAHAEKNDMPIDQTRRTKRTLAALTIGATAALTVSAAALAQSAGGVAGVSASASPDVSVVQAAQGLLEQDRLIQARATLDRLIGSSRFASLGDAERSAALSLLKKIDAKIQTADAVEMSVQKAEWAIGDGDLLQAERQAKAVAGRSSASQSQKARAQDVLSTVGQRRTELSPLTPGLLEQATASMNAGDYPAAKATILGLMRSGVQLSSDQAKGLETAQLRIVELEQKAGRAFELPLSGSLSVMQAGQVRRAGKGDSGRDEPLPATLAQAGQPGDPAYPSDPAQPAFQPSQPAPVQLPPSSLPPPAPMIADAPAWAPASIPQDDIVTQAMRIEAQRIVAEADQAFDQARYGVAVDRYTLAIAQFRQYLSSGDVTRIEGRIAEARVRLAGGGSGSGTDIARDVVASQTLVRDRATAEFNSFLSQADARLNEGAADRAQDLAAQAQLSISRARSAFNDAEIAAFNTRLDALKARITGKRDEIAKTETERRQTELQEKARTTESGRLAERDRKIGESIDRIRALQSEQKYEEALQVVDQTLFLDPNNPTALLLRDILRDVAIYKRYNDLEDQKAYNHALESLRASDATIPPPNMMNFPTDWPAKTFSRGETAAFADSPENRKVLAQISSNASRIPSIDLNENRFEDAVKFLTQVTQLSFDPDWEALAGVGVEKDTLVTLKLTNATVKTVLDRLTQKVSRDQFARAGWAVNEGVLVVSSDEALRRNRTLVIYNIQDLLFEIPNYPDVPQIDLNNVLQQASSGGGGGGQSPFTGAGNNNSPLNDQPTKDQRARPIIELLTQTIETNQWVDNGGEGGSIRFYNGTLIINAPDYMHRQIVGYPYWPSTTVRRLAGGGRYVTLSMDAGVARPLKITNFPVTATAGGGTTTGGGGQPAPTTPGRP